jgi:NitT/TauT family transport system substrate-binding protein
VQNGQQLDVVLSCQNNWITANPELVKRFLKALNQAETYLVNNPSKAEAIVQKQLNVTGTLGAEIWSDHQFSLSLDQSLIASMQDEAQWLIQNNLTNSTAIPNFQNYIYVTGLEAVNPEAVNIAG